MNRANYDWGIKNNDNWCCNTDCEVQGTQIIGFRKNIIQKSAEKNEKSLKTSLKKRAGSNKNTREIQKQDDNRQQQPKNQPPNQFIIVRNIKPFQSSMIIQRLQITQTPSLTTNCIRYTPEKSNHQSKKINFVYNNRPNIPVNKMGVSDLQSIKNETKFFQSAKIHDKNMKIPLNISYSNPHQANLSTNFNTAYNTGNNSAFQSQHKPELGKSTLNTYFNSEKEQSHGDNLVKSKNFKMQLFSPGLHSQRGQQKSPFNTFNSLTSRRQTVLSVNGDSQSQTSIAIMDQQDPILQKINSVQKSKKIEERSKLSPGGLGYSLQI